jgi:hypothetical protein
VSPTAWTLVELPKTDRRHWFNRFNGKKDPVTEPTAKNLQIVVPVVTPPADDVLAAAVANFREAEQPLPIYESVLAKLGFDPFAPAVVSARPRRERRSDYRDAKSITSRVWASIKPDGSIDPGKAIPTSVTNTGELALITKRG